MEPGILAIANRGEIAVRIARTAREVGWQPVVLLGEPDWYSYPARTIERVVRLQAGDELRPAAVVDAARRAGAGSLHPGYGFLSERPELARLCAEAGITFVGPSPETLELAGDKIASRKIAEQRGVPVLTGSPALDLDDPASWERVAGDIGYPVIAKIAGAGGGRGLRVAYSSDVLPRAVQSAQNEASGSGAEPVIYLEHYLEGARHVEVQVAGDGQHAVALGDRDCSLQRRHQKVVEEAPAPGLSDDVRARLHEAAVVMAEAIGLGSLATVEFLIGSEGRFFFMEINPRLQVEHTVTEAVTGLDLVAVQLGIATGRALPEPVPPQGHAIQARLYAEDPFNQFLPSPGTLSLLEFPDPYRRQIPGRLRVDTGYETGDTVPGAYDPLIAKIIAHGTDRHEAIDGLVDALERLRVAGVATNRPWLLAMLAADPRFRENEHDLTTAGSIALEERPPEPEDLSALAPHFMQQSAPSAWGSSGPYRAVGTATIVVHGEEAGGWQRTLEAHPNPAGGGRTVDPVVVAHSDAYELVSPRGRWLVRAGPLASARFSRAQADGVVRAPMPGKVLEMAVEAGQVVEEGQIVAVLEAMKIEISLAAPFTGTVTTVHAAPGDLVGIKQAVVTIEPASGDTAA